MIAVVTGGSGFIGKNLTRRLLDDGHTVRCLVRPLGGSPPSEVERFPVNYHSASSLLNTPAFEGADAVFHLAGATTAVRASAFTEANVIPTRNLLGALVARRLRPRFVLVSSQAAAGPALSRRRPVEEDDPPHPVEAYGRSKLDAERIVDSFTDRLPTTTVRPCAVFGTHDRDFLTLFRYAEWGLLLYPGVRDHWMSLLHVDDVVEGLLTAAGAERAICRTYFLASEEPIQWRTLGAAIGWAVGRATREVNVPAPMIRAASVIGEIVGRLTHTVPLANRSKAALARDEYWVCSASRARAELGFRESRSLPEAVRDTYYWYRRHGWLRGPRREASQLS